MFNMFILKVFDQLSHDPILELGCRDGWDTFQGKCYYYSPDAVVKPDAKRYCWEQRNEAQLLLISTPEENAYFANKVVEKGVASFWLRINDKNVSSKSHNIGRHQKH